MHSRQYQGIEKNWSERQASWNLKQDVRLVSVSSTVPFDDMARDVVHVVPSFSQPMVKAPPVNPRVLIVYLLWPLCPTGSVCSWGWLSWLLCRTGCFAAILASCVVGCTACRDRCFASHPCSTRISCQ